ncbi:uncharacterized protein BO87DRAFT_229125 [Aspergillus neoniger CBS 115656]|uniref:Uncharacterized protein n=1 Tax=Aspergillus neoniger (strain CBS 115656) TaxID=1448310 RepID=A0A318ZLA5_ASPNB|nr:hypothetical protein BO87DRAFT_229125 [Aspergillus neoniger CBS 115656]PYH36702.1 hypothetical protein BO87DRAFT_229125 [Aspergillus neoniger CBS 115656]
MNKTKKNLSTLSKARRATLFFFLLVESPRQPCNVCEKRSMTSSRTRLSIVLVRDCITLIYSIHCLAGSRCLHAFTVMYTTDYSFLPWLPTCKYPLLSR